MNEPNRQISPERKRVYYLGMALLAAGILLFLSTFVTLLANFGTFENFGERAQSMGLRALGGMVLMIAGGLLMRVGAAGPAASGLILDPERARKDVEPWSRMAGGVANDMLSEVEVVQKVADGLAGGKQ